MPLTAEQRSRAIESLPDLIEALASRIKHDLKYGGHAVHPSGRFCCYCGRNSTEEVHGERCPVGLAERTLAFIEGVTVDEFHENRQEEMFAEFCRKSAAT